MSATKGKTRTVQVGRVKSRDEQSLVLRVTLEGGSGDPVREDEMMTFVWDTILHTANDSCLEIIMSQPKLFIINNNYCFLIY
jgi:hypothetical protein